MRIYIAINPPEKIKKEIKRVQDKLPEFVGKKESGKLHLTLKFLGEIDKSTLKGVKERMAKIRLEKFEAEIGKIGYFDNRKSKAHSKKFIVWLHLKNCEKLQELVDDALSDLFEKERRFMGHITIARVKEVKNKEEFLKNVLSIETPKSKFIVDKFFIINSELESTESAHSIVEEFPLS